MEKIDDIDLLEFGNSITIKGVVMENPNEDIDLVLMWDGEKRTAVYRELFPSKEQWYAINKQMDECNIKGKGDVILKKGIRNLDQKICWQVYRRDKYKCRYCGINNVPLTVDHIITWETGGATHPDNLLTCCKKCNRKRGNLDYGSWLQHKYYEEKSKFLTQSVREANEAIIKKLPSLPRLNKMRSR